MPRRLLRVEFDGKVFEWFDIEEMLNVHGAGLVDALVDGIVQNFAVPMECQVLCDGSGPLINKADLRRALLTVAPRLWVFDARRVAGSLRQKCDDRVFAGTQTQCHTGSLLPWVAAWSVGVHPAFPERSHSNGPRSRARPVVVESLGPVPVVAPYPIMRGSTQHFLGSARAQGREGGCPPGCQASAGDRTEDVILRTGSKPGAYTPESWVPSGHALVQELPPSDTEFADANAARCLRADMGSSHQSMWNGGQTGMVERRATSRPRSVGAYRSGVRLRAPATPQNNFRAIVPAPATAENTSLCLATSQPSSLPPAAPARSLVGHIVEATLTKADTGDIFGFANVPYVDQSGVACLRITQVHAAGLLAEWNLLYPDKCLESGDLIMSVNGFTGDHETMRGQLRGSSVRLLGEKSLHPPESLGPPPSLRTATSNSGADAEARAESLRMRVCQAEAQLQSKLKRAHLATADAEMAEAQRLAALQVDPWTPTVEASIPQHVQLQQELLMRERRVQELEQMFVDRPREPKDVDKISPAESRPDDFSVASSSYTEGDQERSTRRNRLGTQGVASRSGTTPRASSRRESNGSNITSLVASVEATDQLFLGSSDASESEEPSPEEMTWVVQTVGKVQGSSASKVPSGAELVAELMGGGSDVLAEMLHGARKHKGFDEVSKQPDDRTARSARRAQARAEWDVTDSRNRDDDFELETAGDNLALSQEDDRSRVDMKLHMTENASRTPEFRWPGAQEQSTEFYSIASPDAHMRGAYESSPWGSAFDSARSEFHHGVDQHNMPEVLQYHHDEEDALLLATGEETSDQTNEWVGVARREVPHSTTTFRDVVEASVWEQKCEQLAMDVKRQEREIEEWRAIAREAQQGGLQETDSLRKDEACLVTGEATQIERAEMADQLEKRRQLEIANQRQQEDAPSSDAESDIAIQSREQLEALRVAEHQMAEVMAGWDAQLGELREHQRIEQQAAVDAVREEFQRQELAVKMAREREERVRWQHVFGEDLPRISREAQDLAQLKAASDASQNLITTQQEELQEAEHRIKQLESLVAGAIQLSPGSPSGHSRLSSTGLPQQMSRSVYVATGDDALDHAVEQELNELGPEVMQGKEFVRMAASKYKFGEKKLFMKLGDDGHVGVRSGGSYIPLETFLGSQFAPPKGGSNGHANNLFKSMNAASPYAWLTRE